MVFPETSLTTIMALPRKRSGSRGWNSRSWPPLSCKSCHRFRVLTLTQELPFVPSASGTSLPPPPSRLPLCSLFQCFPFLFGSHLDGGSLICSCNPANDVRFALCLPFQYFPMLLALPCKFHHIAYPLNHCLLGVS